MATETLPSGNFVADIRRASGRWRLSLGTDRPKEARRRKAMLSMLADTEEGREVLDLLRTRSLSVEQVATAMLPGGEGIASLRPKPSDTTLAQACEAYLAGVKGRKSTRTQVEIVTRQLIDALGAKTPIARVSKSDAQRWLLRSGWSAKTQQYKYAYARAIFAEAKPRANVWDEVKPQKPEKRDISWLTLEETYAFLAQLSVLERAWMGCGFLAGLRVGEARNLRWIDVDLDVGELHVRNRKGAHAWVTKNGKSRVVQIPASLAAMLREWKEESGARGEYVFGLRGVPPHETTVGKWTRAAFERAGMTAGRARDGWTYHAGRHSAASNALRAGAPVAKVAMWLGDTVAVLLSTYSHVLFEDMRKVAISLSIDGAHSAFADHKK